MTRLVIATTSVPGDLLHKLDAIAHAGFDGLEIHERDLKTFSGPASAIASHASDLGLSVDVFQPHCEFEGLSGPDRDRAFDQLERNLGIMGELGARTLLVNATTRVDRSADFQWLTEDFAQLADRMRQAGCRAALLALPWSAHTRQETEALKIVEAVESSHFGLALNAVFSLADGSMAARLRDIPGETIFHVQLCDAPSRDIDLSQQTGHSGLLPSQGSLNLASFVRVLSRAGYSGPWSLASGYGAAADPPISHATDGYRAIVSLLDDVAHTEPGVEMPVPDLPARVHATGFEFIEFAVSDADRRTLESILTGLAFRKERTHRTKTVELWRQGAVNIVVNSETVGFAAEMQAEHGPGVCDLGLRVDDADQTALRAQMLGAPAFQQTVGSGELAIPAVKGVGGSVVHFIDQRSDLHRVWDIEFDPVPRTDATQPAGLRRIDHVAQTMRYQEMQSWLTYYLSTFQMEKADIVGVADPSGLVLSQALSSPEGEVRLNLNGAGEQRTFAGAFLDHAFGAGVQHIAFASDDIFETSLRLKSGGFQRLVIPAHYYDDLRTRFALDEAMIDQLRSGNILYDRDGRGEYFQIYSTSFWGGFFFEVVERRGGYDGYGARNAPIRLAVQMQQIREVESA